MAELNQGGNYNFFIEDDGPPMVLMDEGGGGTFRLEVEFLPIRPTGGMYSAGARDVIGPDHPTWVIEGYLVSTKANAGALYVGFDRALDWFLDGLWVNCGGSTPVNLKKYDPKGER